jgi:DNA-binding NtrC family response regulator
MRKHSVIKRSPAMSATAFIDNTRAILSISPIEEYHQALESIIGHSTMMVVKARDIKSALMLLQRHDIGVIVCERDLRIGTWIDVLEHIKGLPIPPSLIITSRLADDQLWAEALNLGAWDVLASEPFVPADVIRTVKSAWQRWEKQIQTRAAAVGILAAAS